MPTPAARKFQRTTPPIPEHAKVYEFLETMTPAEAFAIAVAVGTHTEDGRLTPPYRHPEHTAADRGEP